MCRLRSPYDTLIQKRHSSPTYREWATSARIKLKNLDQHHLVQKKKNKSSKANIHKSTIISRFLYFSPRFY